MILATDGAGKGDAYRPVNREKYIKNWLEIFGEKCPECGGVGQTLDSVELCSRCEGYGYVEKRKT